MPIVLVGWHGIRYVRKGMAISRKESMWQEQEMVKYIYYFILFYLLIFLVF